MNIFKNMSDDLFISFLIGFIDGDGSIYKCKKNGRSIIITSHKNWNPILEYWVYRLQKIFKINYLVFRQLLKFKIFWCINNVF